MSTQASTETAAATPPAPSNMSRGMRETIESIAIAFALAFLFKTFQAEAFVIPTGSMAPTLMGRHKDIVCPECGFRYSANASDEADNEGRVKTDPGSQVVSTTCPNCRFSWDFDPQRHPEDAGENPSYSGDRIWVSKVPYHLMEPRRWDVVVFRFPEEAEKYYIKRLVGLPNETIRIAYGDIFTRPTGESEFGIQRKPPEKVRAIAQVVHDNDCVSEQLLENDWPARWRAMPAAQSAAAWTVSDDTRRYQTDGNGDESWIRYHHLVPSFADWQDKRWPPAHEPRPQLITDFYAFNTRVLRQQRGMEASALGLHWVGDLMLDCELDVTSATGSVLLDLVKGGRHFRCTLDVATGEVVLTIPGLEGWERTAQTAARGVGKHRFMFGNVDQQLLLWVDDKVVEFDRPATYESLNNDKPDGGPDGDLVPAGIGTRGAAVAVKHLRILRDIYYIAGKPSARYRLLISDYRDGRSRLPGLDANQLAEFFSTPAQWDSPISGNIFDQREPVEFELGPDQFFVLGDNSPASSDARLWSDQHYVERDLLVGKALFVYWPHPLNLWIPFTNTSLGIIPNFPGMGFIR